MADNQSGRVDNLDVTPKQHRELKQLLRQYLPNTEIWAYGSRVTFKTRHASDLDLVVFTKADQHGAVSELRDALEESDLPFSVDVLVWDDMPERFKPNIQQAYYPVQKYDSAVCGSVVLVPRGWSTKLLSELVVEDGGVQTGPFGSQLHQRDYVEVGTPIITVEHLGENRILHTNLPRVSDVDRKRLSKYAMSAGDIIFSRVGSVDRRSIVRQSEDGWLFSGRCLRVRVSSNKIDSMYLAYYLGDPRVKQYVRSVAVGATMPSINTKILSELPVSFPPDLKNQKAIAHVLGALDDKIELNMKMNQALENIAKAIFKSWFVDFDPVRAKAEGRSTGLPSEISDLFPSELVESKVGEVPKGWKRIMLGDLVVPKKGQTITKKKCIEGEVPVVAGGLEPAYFHNASNVKAPVVTISASGANAGYARLYHQDIWASDCSFISKEQSAMPYLWYVFLKLNQDNIYHMQQEAAQPHIYPSDLMRLEICVPETNLLWNKLNELVSPIFERIGLSICEHDVLVAIRDTLLPKLISGELRIPDAEKFLEQAGI